MQVVEFDYNSSLYFQTCAFRDRFLRQPLGISLWNEDLTVERYQLHFGVLQVDQIIAGLIIVPLQDNNAKLRQMWVDKPRQNQGIGTFLITEVERRLAQRGFKKISLAARFYAISFYEKLGFQKVGQEFEEVGIPHFMMQKELIFDETGRVVSRSNGIWGL